MVTYLIAAGGGCAAFNATASVTITAAPSATISYAGTPYCSSAGTASVTRTGSAGGTYSASPAGLMVNASTGTITLGTSIPGSYTVTYLIAAGGGCAAFSTTAAVTVTAAPSATISYNGSPYCTGAVTANVTRVGSSGGLYSAIPTGLSLNASTGAIDLAGSMAGSYSVTYTIAAGGGCAAFTATASVTVTAAPSATIVYMGSPYCNSGTTANVTRTGSAGGAYGAAPSGLSINASTGTITLGTSTPGSYTVTYAFVAGGGCGAFSTTTTVVITAAPNATIAYNGSPYCSSGTLANVLRTGSPGGTYSVLPAGLTINAATGSINLGASTPGTYTVTYSIAAGGGCAAFSTTAQVVITAAPGATIAYAGTPYCSSAGTASVTLTGSTGGTYSAVPSGLSLNGTTGAITLGTSTAGSYTVTYSIAAGGGCALFSTTASVTIAAAPNATIAYAGSPYCSGGTIATVTRTGSSGGTYSAVPAGLSLNASTGAITLGASTPGNYTVTYSIVAGGGCGGFSTTATVEIGSVPSAVIVYAGSPYCGSGAVANVTRTGSAGGTYSGSPTGLSLNVASGAVDLTASTEGTYTVTYSIAAAGGCSAFTTTASITITAAPSASISYAGWPYCTSEGAVAVTQTGNGGGSYTATPGGLSLNASNGSIDPGMSAAGTYTVMYSIAASGGCAVYNAMASVVVTAAPSATIAYTGTPYCSSAGTASVVLSGSAGGAYSASPSGLSVNASTGAINLGTSTPGSYTVTYSIAAGGGCAAFSTTATVMITAAPSATIAYTGTPYCSSGTTVSVVLSGSTGGAYSASPTGLSINASTGAITLGTSTPGTYTVSYAIAAGGGCAAFSTTASVTITAAPSATITYSGSPYCNSAGMANVALTGTTGGTFGTSPAGLVLNAATGAIDLGASIPGSYTVTYAIAAGGGCSAVSTTTSVVVTAAPSATISYGGPTICGSSGTASVTLVGTTGGQFTASPAGMSIDPNTGAIGSGSSNPGTYTVTYTIAASGGCSAFSATATVEIVASTVWYADQDGDGIGDDTQTITTCAQPAGYVAISGDLCPTDPNKVAPGTCGCGVPDTDTDGDGVADCIDSCPDLPGGVGDSCDDGDPNTLNDVITSDCVCAGTLYDCPGIMANFGDSCDDGNANTIDDIITSECICQGSPDVGITEAEGGSGASMELFPNPNRTGMVNLRIKGLSIADAHVVIVVLDVAGHQVHSETAEANGGTLFQPMDLARKLSSGLYMVEAIVGGHRYLQQLVIQ